ncbi:MAG TPA: DUF1295 domain-containing protein [Candidatus Saccharimonadales bacterium]
MGFLAKTPQVSWPTAGLIVFLCSYLAAALTVLFMEHMAGQILAQTTTVGCGVLVYMSIIFLLSRFLGRLDIVDAGWGGAFVVAAITAWVVNQHQPEIGWNIQTLTTGLVVIWATRLSYHVIKRLMRQSEDKRYSTLRKNWKGNEIVNAYVRVFLLQAVLATIISIALIHINISTQEAISYWTILGAAIWTAGFIFESVADMQLKNHIKNRKNSKKLLTSGLWKYTRHPNYFGEATMWWGILVIACGTPYGWVGIITPVVITYLLLFVSGVPLAEKALEKRKGWKVYKNRTSIFVPLPPRSAK